MVRRFLLAAAFVCAIPALAVAQLTPAPTPTSAVGPTGSIAASTCAAPGLNTTGATTTGIATATTPSVSIAVAGNCIVTATATTTTSSVPHQQSTDGSGGGYFGGALNDVQWYRSAADIWRTPDSVQVDGGIGIGTSDTTGLTVSGISSAGSNSAVTVTNAGQTGFGMVDSTAAVDTKNWDTIVSSTVRNRRVVTDNNSGATVYESVTRSGTTVTSIDWTAASLKLNSALLDSSTDPTIASGGCTTPAISANGTLAILVTIGTSCTGIKTVTLTFPAAPTLWACSGNNNTSDAQQQTNYPAFRATSTTAVVLTSYDRVTGLPEDFNASDTYLFQCRPM